MIEAPAPPHKKNKKYNKGIRTDSLLLSTLSGYIRLIGDADRKARIMIIVNSILLTISVTLLTRSIHSTPDVWISAALLLGANMFTLFFSVVSVKPELHSSRGLETENYILHYKKCSEYTLDDYTSKLLAVTQDDDKKREALIKNIYFFGNLLNRKYKLLKIAYRVFFWGILLSVTSYLIILLLARS